MWPIFIIRGKNTDTIDGFLPFCYSKITKIRYIQRTAIKKHLYHPVVIKDKHRFWKGILIVDDNEDVTTTFKVGIKDGNNSAHVNKRIEVHT